MLICDRLFGGTAGFDRLQVLEWHTNFPVHPLDRHKHTDNGPLPPSQNGISHGGQRAEVRFSRGISHNYNHTHDTER